MTEYVGKTMIVDTRVADGGVTFEKDCFIWKARHDTNLQNRIVVNYKDIKEIKVDHSSNKKRVAVIMNNDKVYYFYLYKVETFLELIEAGKEGIKAIESGETLPISDDDLERLSKLVELHKEGVLTDSQFESQKNEIMKKYN